MADRLLVVTGADDVERAAADAGDDAVELVVGSSSLPVGRALSRHLGDAPVTLLAAGATAYGPTYGALQGRLAKRVRQVLHLDLVPELEPLLLDERDVPARPVPLASVRAVAASLPSPGPVPDPTTLALGRSAAWAAPWTATTGPTCSSRWSSAAPRRGTRASCFSSTRTRRTGCAARSTRPRPPPGPT